MNQEMKQIIAANLKPVLAKYKVKGTLSIRNYSSIILTLQSGAVNFEKDYTGKNFNNVGELWHPSQDFTDASGEFLKQARKALESAGWYDKTDAQIDYFHTAYYAIIKLKPYGKDYKYIGD